jgi:DNA-binding response OmpR family regulator
MAGTQAILDKKRVLIVEDDLFLVRLYQLHLSKFNIETLVAADGETALAMMRENQPQAVLLDLMLPGMNGFELLSAIRGNEKWKDTPVVIVSNLAQDADVKRAKEMGVKEYIVKARMKLTDVVEVVSRLFT